MPEPLPLPAHGGDPAVLAQRYGAGPWLDFSANVNPAAPPPAALAALRAGAADVAGLARYPNESERALRAALARVLAIGADRVVVANGAAALIEAFVRTVAPRRCLVPQPAFSEYARALAAQGTQTLAFPLSAAADFALDVEAFVATLHAERPDACVVNNPHNPSGALVPRDGVAQILAAARSLDVAVLVDEAFVDYAPEASVAGLVADGAVLVVRSLTKLYALPALRVGYALAPPAFARAVAARIPSWPVTALAADAARAALDDAAYVEQTRGRTARDRDALAAALRALGLRVFPSHANFVLVETPLPSSLLAERLARGHRIAVRDCSSYPGLERGGCVRVCVRSAADNAVLVAALAAELLAVQRSPDFSPFKG